MSATSLMPVTVQYQTNPGTALAGVDYQTTSGLLTFNPGQSDLPVGVPVIGNQLFEADKTFTLDLSGASGGFIVDGSAVGTIRNDDADVSQTGVPGTVVLRGDSEFAAALTALAPGFVAAWPPGPTTPDTTATTHPLAASSGQGIAAVLCGTVNAGVSSRALSSSEADCNGTPQSVLSSLDVWKVARDANVMVISNSTTLNPITGLSPAQVAQIYGQGASYSSAPVRWTDLNGSWPSIVAVPRARQLQSGARVDLLTQTFTADATEQATITATEYSRLATPSDMADAVACNVGQLGYVSLASVAHVCSTDPSKGLRVLPVSGVPPTASSVGNATYPFTRTIRLLTRRLSINDANYKARVHDLVNYVYSAGGKQP